LPFTLLDRTFAPAPDPARVAWLAGRDYAHRGLHGAGRPENSLSAFAAAIEAGMGIECDVQKSSDGQAMVFHDWELSRLTGEAGDIAARQRWELAQVALGASAHGDRIPHLSDLLELAAGRVPLLIEIKSNRDRRPAPLCLAVRNALEGYQGPAAIMSFDPRVPRWFCRHAAHIVRGLVVTEENDRTVAGSLRRRLWLWHARPDFLAYDIRDLPSRFAASQRARGFPLLSWTVRSAELRTRAAAYADAPIAEGAGVASAEQNR
jgi:glycerophosphoryl diester phosphodiesterase